jgi:hypothetical protein
MNLASRRRWTSALAASVFSSDILRSLCFFGRTEGSIPKLYSIMAQVRKVSSSQVRGTLSSVGSWWVDWVRARALPFLAASSAAFAASSAFGLALLGAIAGGFVVARTVGAKCWNSLSVARKPTGVNSVDSRVTRGWQNSSLHQASHGHCVGVFIGTRAPSA